MEKIENFDTTPRPGETDGHKKSHEGNLLGLHDYKSYVRELGYAYRNKNAKELFTYNQEHPPLPLDEYVEKIKKENSDLYNRIQIDKENYPEKFIELAALIQKLRTTENEETVVKDFEEIKDFFGYKK